MITRRDEEVRSFSCVSSSAALIQAPAVTAYAQTPVLMPPLQTQPVLTWWHFVPQISQLWLSLIVFWCCFQQAVSAQQTQQWSAQ